MKIPFQSIGLPLGGLDPALQPMNPGSNFGFDFTDMNASPVWQNPHHLRLYDWT